MRTKIKKWSIFISILGMAFILSGCFFSEGEISINEGGEANISTSFWFKKGSMGAENQGSIAMSQLLFLFPEIQTYDLDVRVKKEKEEIFADEYLVYTFEKDAVEINDNRFIKFKKQENGSYLFLATIPQALDERVSESDDKHIITIRLILPLEIEMANSMDYSGKTVEWKLRTNDFTKEIMLKAYTKTPKIESK